MHILCALHLWCISAFQLAHSMLDSFSLCCHYHYSVSLAVRGHILIILSLTLNGIGDSWTLVKFLSALNPSPETDISYMQKMLDELK